MKMVIMMIATVTMVSAMRLDSLYRPRNSNVSDVRSETRMTVSMAAAT